MKKRYLFIPVFLLIAALLGGCIEQYNTIEIHKDGTATVLSETWIASEYAAGATVSEGAVHTQETIDGVPYEKYVETKTFKNLEELQTELSGNGNKAIVNTKTFELISETELMEGMSQEDLESVMKAEYTVTMPAKIEYTNGVVDPSNPNKVKWDSKIIFSEEPLRAYCSGSAEYETFRTPVISGVKKNTHYKKTVTVLAASDSGIKTVTLNGTKQSASKIKNGISVSKSGKYTVKATSNLGKSTSITFYVDKAVPVISGAANGKTYKKNVTLKITDKIALKSVTVNGTAQSSAKIKSGIKLSKNGTYKVVATDKAGNKKTITFKIKK